MTRVPGLRPPLRRWMATASLLLLPLLPLPAAAASFEASAQFQVVASKLLLRAARQVTVQASIADLGGELHVQLDRPVKARLGVREVALTLRLLDSVGRQVDAIQARLKAGESALSVPLRLPAPGRYRLVLTEADVEAGTARIRILPAGMASLELLAGASTLARR